MKFMFTALVCSIGLMLQAQDLPKNEKTGKITYMGVKDAEGVSPADVLKEAKKWATSNNGWTEKSATADEVMYDVSLPLFYPSPTGGKEHEGVVKFTFSVFVKDGRYRYIVTDFVHKGKIKGYDGGRLEEVSPECGKSKLSGRGWVTIKNNTNKKVNDLVSELNRTIKEFKNDPANNDDW